MFYYIFILSFYFLVMVALFIHRVFKKQKKNMVHYVETKLHTVIFFHEIWTIFLNFFSREIAKLDYFSHLGYFW